MRTPSNKKKYNVTLLSIILFLTPLFPSLKAEAKLAWVYYEIGNSHSHFSFFEPSKQSLSDEVEKLKKDGRDCHKFEILLKDGTVKSLDSDTDTSKIKEEQQLITKTLKQWKKDLASIGAFNNVLTKSQYQKFGMYSADTYDKARKAMKADLEKPKEQANNNNNNSKKAIYTNPYFWGFLAAVIFIFGGGIYYAITQSREEAK